MPPGPEARIHLASIVANWRALARPGCETGAVVKANAYGHGMEPVSKALAEAGCRTFFVARASEGYLLRSLLGDAPVIYVFDGPDEAEAARMASAGLVPVANTPAQLALWAQDAPGKPYGLMIDTGMNRLGIRHDSLGALSDSLRAAPPVLLLSHFACADTPGHPLNAEQLARFTQATAPFPGVPRSLCNSAGIHLGHAMHFDVTRPGIGLYGGGGFGLRPGMTLTAPVLQVTDARPGETVGYGATATLDAPTRLATLGIGYGDGFPRSASGKGFAVIDGHSCPILGRVSMDLITVDASALPHPPRPGDRAELIGPAAPLERQAALAGTLGYELVTGLTPRVARVYEAA